MIKGVAIALVVALVIAVPISATWSDKVPFCLFPGVFPVSMSSSPATVDLAQYSGLWYEIARKPMPQEAKCNCAEALYTPNPAGYVDVKNSCTTFDGKSIVAVAKAYTANTANTRLKVYFTPYVAGAYWILDIDPNYQWVVVGEPCKWYAWVLSRSKTMDKASLEARVAVLEAKGYKTNDIIYRGKC